MKTEEEKWEIKFSKKFTDNVLKDGYGNDLITDQASPIMKFLAQQIQIAREEFVKEINEFNQKEKAWGNGYDCIGIEKLRRFMENSLVNNK